MREAHYEEDKAGDQHHGRVVLVPWLLEEIEHTLRHDKATDDVHS
eukprot:CAMPEP_0115268484 /NCGR_PEP_ID=MMETSP0270-20121206/52544_1 /TAXON_ID=71861 /ORGANISM="Scrippsiella trochoidea, Strain CCMP3099" /LENGTH=44 /DNA_ID= /DNA_START= /DNA_END= /DNA_ORIENTATION=